MKAAFLDLDGVCFDSTERFNRARKGNGKIDFAIALDPALVVLDVPIEGASEGIRSLIEQGYTVVLLTGRPEKMRQATIARLQEHDMQCHALLMRKDGDYRKSPFMKAEAVTDYLFAHPDIEEILMVDDQVENSEAIVQALAERANLRQRHYESLRYALLSSR